MNIWHHSKATLSKDGTLVDLTAALVSLSQKQERLVRYDLCDEGFIIQSGDNCQYVIHCDSRDEAIDTILEGHKRAQEYWDNGIMNL